MHGTNSRRVPATRYTRSTRPSCRLSMRKDCPMPEPLWSDMLKGTHGPFHVTRISVRPRPPTCKPRHGLRGYCMIRWNVRRFESRDRHTSTLRTHARKRNAPGNRLPRQAAGHTSARCHLHLSARNPHRICLNTSLIAYRRNWNRNPVGQTSGAWSPSSIVWTG